MKTKIFSIMTGLLLCGPGSALHAAQPSSEVSGHPETARENTGAKPDEAVALRKRVADLEQRLAEQQKMFQRQLDEMKRQIAGMKPAPENTAENGTPATAELPGAAPPTPTGEPGVLADNEETGSGGRAAADLELDLARELGMDLPGEGGAGGSAEAAGGGWSPADPLTFASAGGAYMNVSLDVLMDLGTSSAENPGDFLNLGDHDPHQRGFSMPNTELAIDGAVDPYFKGFANIVFKLDDDSSTHVEMEEAYLQTTSLPWNLQVRGGQFFAHFGRQNCQHPHTWGFVDQALMLTRAFGPDGLRNPGLELSWLAPTPFYLNFELGVFNGKGGTAWSFRNTEEVHGRASLDTGLASLSDLLYVPRVSASFDIGDTQTLVLGLSGAFGPNDTGYGTRTSIGGADLYWKWKPTNAHQGFPFVSWQTEFLYSSFEAGADPTAPGGPLPAETLHDWGGYSQILWGIKPRWVLGLRGEWVDGNRGAYDPDDVFRGRRVRISPNITWYPSEFSKLRLQYDYDDLEGGRNENSVWLQAEFLLGSHAAHKF